MFLNPIDVHDGQGACDNINDALIHILYVIGISKTVALESQPTTSTGTRTPATDTHTEERFPSYSVLTCC